MTYTHDNPPSIREAILTFLRNRHKYGSTRFHASELRDYVSSWGIASAPASTDRVLRMVRKSGEASYRVLNRAESLYQIESVSA